ncbi:hypothetical protein [Aquimarina latercula]|uniref:hypothetical protein n=1 Tax=Aquimarina latercula TaxID=987 RepID=UPI000400B1FD|nr:hypothetical protein [Aquimarina latercula]
MPRTIEEIQQTILTKKIDAQNLQDLEVLTTNEENTIDALTSDSKVSVWRVWVYIVAFVIFTLEMLWDIFRKEVDTLIEENELHNFPWYKKKALSFQYGQALVPETDYYDNTGLTVQQIQNRKIVKHVSVIRKISGGKGFLELKLAKEINGELIPLNAPEMEAFQGYMFLVADAGTFIEYISLPNDSLRLVLDIYYDPLVLYSDGQRKDGTDNQPVQKAINDFLYNLEFNGELILDRLLEHLRTVEGVKIPVIREAFTKFGAFDYEPLDVSYIARAGYMRLDTENTLINYIPREL